MMTTKELMCRKMLEEHGKKLCESCWESKNGDCKIFIRYNLDNVNANIKRIEDEIANGKFYGRHLLAMSILRENYKKRAYLEKKLQGLES